MVETMVTNIAHKPMSADLKDLSQMVYLILMGCDGNCRRMKNYDRRLRKEQEDLLARLTNSEDSACKKD